MADRLSWQATPLATTDPGMYLEHYGLTEPPFSITPDPRFVFLSERHRDALAHLLFGIDKGGGGGFVQLTGEVGTGKTTLCRLMLEQLPDNTRVALVLNPRQSPVELLETICEELHIDLHDGRLHDDVGASRRGSLKALVDALNAYLLDAYAKGLRVVLIIDEAQDLSIEALEQVRLLTNLETDTQKLLQVILLGQPELREILAREDLRQLAQRITARFHLTPLDPDETERYLRHRYAIAGGKHLPFDKSAIRRLHARAGGVPRLINVIAERSLLAGYARDQTHLDARLVDVAAAETLPSPSPRIQARHQAWLALALLAMVAVALTTAYALRPKPAAVVAAAPAPAAEKPERPAATKPKAGAVPILDTATVAARIAAGDAAPLESWRALLALWQLPTGADDVAIAAQCAPLLASGVYCLRARGGLDTLTEVGRPVVLHLRGGGRSGWGLLLGVDALRARLRMGGDTFDVPRVALQSLWNGEYAAVWRGPPDLVAPLQPDSGGPAARWLRQHLGPEATTSIDDTVPDTGMLDDVRRFQADHGLAADGIVGPETLFALSASDSGPQLLRELD